MLVSMLHYVPMMHVSMMVHKHACMHDVHLHDAFFNDACAHDACMHDAVCMMHISLILMHV